MRRCQLFFHIEATFVELQERLHTSLSVLFPEINAVQTEVLKVSPIEILLESEKG